MSQHQVDPEIIQTKCLMPANGDRTVRARYPLGPRHLQLTSQRIVASDGFYVESDDWILLNGPRGTSLRSAVLDNFDRANAWYDAMSLNEIWLRASGNNGAPLELKVVVPRFTTEPPGLSDCTGFAYDKESRRLRVGSKFIAYLWPAQPQLTK
jgi:hypothetical protein